MQLTKITRISVALEAGRVYRFETYDSTGDPFVHLLDSSNMEVASNDDGFEWPDKNAAIEYPCAVTGTYFLVVRGATEYVAGTGKVRWASWLEPSPPESPTYSDLTPFPDHFGGIVYWMQPNQPEYRTVKPQPYDGVGSPDTVLYTMDYSGRITGFDDDSGVGRMSRVRPPLYTSFPTYSVLVGSYGVGSAGTTDIIANDLDHDSDGDGVGRSVEEAYGTCDGSLAFSHCASLINYKDSDHDGLSDDAEIFGIDYAPDPDRALHLPAWGATPVKKDVFIEVDWGDQRTCQAEGACSTDDECNTPVDRKWLCVSGVCTEQWNSLPDDIRWPPGATFPFTEARARAVQSKLDFASASEVGNLPFGGTGVSLHYDLGSYGSSCTTYYTLCGSWGGGGTKTFDQQVHVSRVGVFRHMRVDPGVGGQATGGTTFKVGVEGPEPRTALHELGHSLGLTHGGHPSWDSSLAPLAKEINCKPHYNSLMNYSFDGTWDSYEFSHGTNPGTLDPSNVNEYASPFEVPTPSAFVGRLKFDYSLPLRSSHLFPTVNDGLGQVDWNRDGVIEAGARRGSLVAAGPQCSAHRLSAVELLDPPVPPEAPATDAGTATPDLAAFRAQWLYAFYVNAAQSAVVYRSAELGPRSEGNCTVGSGRAWEACHAFSGRFAPPALAVPAGVHITAVSALQWNDELVVAYVGDDHVVRVNRATDFIPSTGELSGWATTSTAIASDAMSRDIELSPMYVLATEASGYPRSDPEKINSELLAVFYTTNTNTHRFRYATPGSPLSAWSSPRDVTVGGVALTGDEGAGVTVWPARSAILGANNHVDIGQACGVFPRVLVPGGGPSSPANRYAELYCYNKLSDQWDSVNVAWSSSLGRKPSIAFHTLRAADGSPLDETRGQFFAGESTADGGIIVSISEEISPALPPTGRPWTAPIVRFHRPEQTWNTEARTAVSLYADRDLGALKSLGLFRYKESSSAPLRSRLEVQGLFDGSFHAELKDGNDFHVIEQGICRRLHPGNDRWCCKSANPADPCLGLWDLPL